MRRRARASRASPRPRSTPRRSPTQMLAYAGKSSPSEALSISAHWWRRWPICCARRCRSAASWSSSAAATCSTIEADASGMQQVLLNLVLNASEARDDAAMRIVVSHRRRADLARGTARRVRQRRRRARRRRRTRVQRRRPRHGRRHGCTRLRAVLQHQVLGPRARHGGGARHRAGASRCDLRRERGGARHARAGAVPAERTASRGESDAARTGCGRERWNRAARRRRRGHSRSDERGGGARGFPRARRMRGSRGARSPARGRVSTASTRSCSISRCPT